MGAYDALILEIACNMTSSVKARYAGGLVVQIHSHHFHMVRCSFTHKVWGVPKVLCIGEPGTSIGRRTLANKDMLSIRLPRTFSCMRSCYTYRTSHHQLHSDDDATHVLPEEAYTTS